MGIKNIESYKPTEHAKKRLKERFMTSPMHSTAWLLTFNKHAELLNRTTDGREVWQSGEAVVVIEPATRAVITVYTKEGRPTIDRVIHDERLKAELIQFAFEREQTAKTEFSKRIHELLLSVDATAYGISLGTMDYADSAFQNMLRSINDIVDTRDEASEYLEQLERLKG